MRLKKLLLAALLLGLVPAAAWAGEHANAPTNTGETGLFTLLSGDTLPQGGWSLGFYYNNWNPVLRQPGFPDQKIFFWNRYDASIGYGLTDRWELAVSVPYDNYAFTESILAPYLQDQRTAFGTLPPRTHIRRAGQSAERPTVATAAGR